MRNLDWEEIISITLMSAVIFLAIAAAFFAIFSGFDYDEEKSKKECYEIYATDKVVLKKCEKYFEG